MESGIRRLEQIHAARLDDLRTKETIANAQQYNQLRTAESHARLDMEIFRLELAQHQKTHAKAVSV